MMTKADNSESAGGKLSQIVFTLEWAVGVVAGWCTGMFAAYDVILSKAKIGSGPLAHPQGTWFVGVRSAVLAIILATVVWIFLGRSRKRLLLGPPLGMAVPLGTLFWLYN
jgi:hypothetical protein